MTPQEYWEEMEKILSPHKGELVMTSTEPNGESTYDAMWENIETYDRTFVSDLPWYNRFIIWLFPRMFWLEDYPVE